MGEVISFFFPFTSADGHDDITAQHSTIEVLFLRVFLVGPLASDVLANVFGTPFNHGMPKFLFASPVWSCKKNKNTKRDSQNRTTKKLSPITISNRMHVARKPPTPAALLVFSLPPPFFSLISQTSCVGEPGKQGPHFIVPSSNHYPTC